MIQEIFLLLLTKGLFTLVDGDTYRTVGHLNWFASKAKNGYYAKTNIKRDYIGNYKSKYQLVYLHHVIMGNPLNGLTIDHIDGNTLNNTKNNLRIVTQRQQCQNRHINKSSKYPGVYLRKCKYKDKIYTYWDARIRIKGKIVLLGSFKIEEEAYKVYQNALLAL